MNSSSSIVARFRLGPEGVSEDICGDVGSITTLVGERALVGLLGAGRFSLEELNDKSLRFTEEGRSGSKSGYVYLYNDDGEWKRNCPGLETESEFEPEFHYGKIVRDGWMLKPLKNSRIQVYDGLPKMVKEILQEEANRWRRPDAFYITQHQKDRIIIEQRRFFPEGESGRLSRMVWQEGKIEETFYFHRENDEWKEGYIDPWDVEKASN